MHMTCQHYKSQQILFLGLDDMKSKEKKRGNKRKEKRKREERKGKVRRNLNRRSEGKKKSFSAISSENVASWRMEASLSSMCTLIAKFNVRGGTIEALAKLLGELM